MSRRPIEQERQGLQTPRERMWAVMLTLRSGFTAADVRGLCRPTVSLNAAKEYVEALFKAGYLKRGREKGQARLRNDIARFAGDAYDLIKAPFEAPRVTYGGKAVVQGLGVLSMWRAMKVLKSFDHHEVAATASQNGVQVQVGAAKSYVAALARAGYFSVVAPARPGKAARYRLSRNTGPHAPAITRRKCVFDRNTGDFAALESAQEVCDGLE